MISIEIESITYSSGIVTVYGRCDVAYEIDYSIDSGDVYLTKGVERDGQEFWVSYIGPGESHELMVRSTKDNEQSLIQRSVTSSVGPRLVTKIVNHIDEIGLRHDLDRHPGETNESYRDAILDKTDNKHNNTRGGLINAIARELDLPIWRNFFSVKVRTNLLTNLPYKKVFMGINSSYAWVSIADDIATEKPDIASSVARLSQSIGIGAITVTIGDGGPIVSADRYAIDNENNTIKFAPNFITEENIDKLHISYPRQHKFNYFDARTDGSISKKTVLDVQQWLVSLHQVEVGGVMKPLILTRDFYYEEIYENEVNGAPFDIRFNIQEVFDDDGGQDIVLISPTGQYYQRNYNQVDKSIFLAQTMIEDRFIELGQEEYRVQGSPVTINSLANNDFLSMISNKDMSYQNTRLERYANELRDVVHIGIYNTQMDFDTWGADSESNIGPAVLQSLYDPKFNLFSVLKTTSIGENDVVKINANQRRHYMKEALR